MWGMKDYYLGHISTANPMELSRVLVKEPCTECASYGLCGGRCLYANIVKRWDSNAYNLVCVTVKNLLDAVSEETPRIEKLIKRGRISVRDFDFVRYNGCEIIP